MPATIQAGILLKTLFNLLPLIQTASGQTTKGLAVDHILSSIEADDFVSALDNFISEVISRPQSESKDISIEADVLPQNNRAQETDQRDGLEDDETIFDGGIEGPILQRSLSIEDEQRLENGLQDLRKNITQMFPIRLLHCNEHQSKLKISLMERADVYNYLAPKFRASYYDTPMSHYTILLWIAGHAKYAILSHTWTQTPGELTYGDWQKGSLDASHAKCQKVVNFCKAAWEDYGITFGWIDTVCINKESSAELDESIRSMYAWYSNAAVSITYLARTSSISDMCGDPWFTRGWTFQELVAPPRLKFYNTDWNQLKAGQRNDKEDPSITESIKRATTMTEEELQNLQRVSISRRMELAAMRKVTREEDIAYSLMGIFDVSISTEYGEGAGHAFFRLVKEILDSTKYVLDIFNWGGRPKLFTWMPKNTSLLPRSPLDYVNRSSVNFQSENFPWRPMVPLTITHLGLRTPILLMPSVSTASSSVSVNNRPIGDYHATVSIQKHCHTWMRLVTYYHILHHTTERMLIIETPCTFGTLNVEGDGTRICIPKTCFAVLLELEQHQPRDQKVEAFSQTYKKVYTEKPIVFDLRKNGGDFGDKHYYEIKQSELGKHGMELVTLYL